MLTRKIAVISWYGSCWVERHRSFSDENRVFCIAPTFQEYEKDIGDRTKIMPADVGLNTPNLYSHKNLDREKAMDRYFETLGTSTYLSVQLSEDDQLDSMSLGMLTNNTIPGFASATFMQMNDKKYIKYNITSKVAVSKLFSGPVNRKRLIGVFSGIVNAMLSAEDYMLDPDMIMMDLDYIFADVSSCETILICLPVIQESRSRVDLSTFLKTIMFSTQFDQTEKCDHVAQILNYLNSAASLSLSEFKEVLDNLSEAPKPVVAKPVQPIQPVQPVQSKPQPVVKPASAVTIEDNKQSTVNEGVRGWHLPSNGQGGTGFDIPGVTLDAPVDLPQSGTDSNQQSASDEKPMSWLYLMQHYNKENAAIYKAQQEAKKSAPSALQKKKPAKEKKGGPEKRQPQKKVGFAVPGDSVPEFGFHQQDKNSIQQPMNQQSAVGQPMNQQPVAQQPQTYTPAPPAPINFGQTTILGAENAGTTVLAAPPMQGKTEAYLVRIRTGEKIVLNKPTFKIGKERSYVDYAVVGNSAVSRSHAMIINRDGGYLVEDTNSTNHTYVDGKMIAAGVATRIQDGTRLRFADEEFEFKMQ